jgi:molybdopterin synthase sulfur carrier subunit
MIKFLFFAGIAEKTGLEKLDVDLKEVMVAQEDSQVTEPTVRACYHYLLRKFPVIEHDLERAMIAVNEEFSTKDRILVDADIVAIIPPVSGG